MRLSEREKRLLEKLENKELDGIIPGDIRWTSRRSVCHKIILDGIPCFISIDTGPGRCYPKVILEQYYETDEMKLWFLKHHGHGMSDPDVVEYSRLWNMMDYSMLPQGSGAVFPTHAT